MRLIVILFSVMTALVVSIYVMVFTSFGHGILLPIIESKIEQNMKINDAKFTSFSLSTNSIVATLTLDEQPIHIEGKFNLFSKNVDLLYDVKVKNINIFNKLANQKLQGEFNTNGRVFGIIGNIALKGNAAFANGTTDYALLIQKEDITDINFSLKNLSLEKLLWMVNKPQYATAKLNIDGKINSLNNLDGDIVTKLDNGLLNSDYINKTFQQNLPTKSTFDLTINSNLNKDNITSIVEFNSFVAAIDTKKTLFNIPSGKLTTDYLLSVPDLDKLYFVTNQHMKGGIVIDGEVIFDKTLLATFNSNKFDGTIKGKLDNNKLNVKLDNIQSLKLLDMLNYPQIFKSNIALDLDYDLATKKGLSKLTTNNGQFLTNQTTQMLKQFTQYDLTLEIYRVTNLTTNIDNTKLVNDLYMKSENSEIKSKVFNIDTEKSTINADLNIKYRKYDLGVTIKGDIANPKVKLDAGDVIKEKVKENIKKEIIDKKLNEKLDKKIGNILNILINK